jgi:hypothetical protein
MLTCTAPETLFKTHSSQVDHRIRRASGFLLVAYIENASDHHFAFPLASSPRRFRCRLATIHPERPEPPGSELNE